MKLEYGLGLASLDKMQLPETIKIKYIGRFNFSKTNAIYHISRTRDSITMTPVKTNISIKDKVLFTYNGYIKILNCTVGRRNIIVNSKYIDKWGLISSNWEEMALDWDDYIMDLKINSNEKRLKYKELNKNELQQLFKTKILY